MTLFRGRCLSCGPLGFLVPQALFVNLKVSPQHPQSVQGPKITSRMTATCGKMTLKVVLQEIHCRLLPLISFFLLPGAANYKSQNATGWNQKCICIACWSSAFALDTVTRSQAKCRTIWKLFPECLQIEDILSGLTRLVAPLLFEFVCNNKNGREQHSKCPQELPITYKMTPTGGQNAKCELKNAK